MQKRHFGAPASSLFCRKSSVITHSSQYPFSSSSLATQRLIEEQGLADELHFQGSICGDGPYDLVSTMRYYLEDDGTSYGVETSHRKGLATIPAVVPLILKGMVETHPDLAAYKTVPFV